MKVFDLILTQSVVALVGWALIHFLWQGTLVALLLANVLTLLQQRAANLRYLVACAALLLMLILPPATIWMIGLSSPEVKATRVPIGPTSSVPSRTLWSTINSKKADTTASPSALPTTNIWQQQLDQRISPWLPWMTSAWLIGVLLLSLRLLGGWFYTQRLRQQCEVVERWQQALRHLCNQLRITRSVRLCASAWVQVPMAIGWLSPVILLPTSALTGLQPQQLEAIIAHELAHIRRHDYLVNLLQRMVETLLFYHPAVWWVSRQVRVEREHCCDDVAVAVCGDARTYALALTEMEALRAASPQLAVAANGGSLLNRIRRLVGVQTPHSNSFAGLLVAIVVIATLVAVLAPGSPMAFIKQQIARQSGEAQSQGDHSGTPQEQATTRLLAALKGRDWQVSGEVAEALRQIKESGTLDPLIAALQGTDWRAREKAAWAMGILKDERAVEPLIARLKDEYSQVQHTVAWSLGMIGDRRAVEPLLANLKTASAEGRQGAAWALGNLRDNRAVEPLIEALKNGDSDVRHSAARSLGMIGDQRAIEPLTAALQDSDGDVREIAAKALGWVKSRGGVGSLIKTSENQAEEKPGAPPAQSKNNDHVEFLLAALKDQDVYVRDDAITALGQIGDKRAVEPLIALLKDDNVYIRDNAISSLGKLGDQRAIEPLIAALQDPNVYIRDNAITALGQLRAVPAVKPLIAMLKDRNVYLRDNAASALGQIGDKRAIEPLKAALSDDNWYVRETATKALRELSKL